MKAADVICYGVLFVIGLLFVIGGIRNVLAYQRLVVLRLGKVLDKPRGPGLVFLIPFFDRGIKVDLREQQRKVSNQEATTKDFIPVSIAFSLYYKVVDPVKAIVYIASIEEVMVRLVSTRLGQVIHEIDSRNLLSEQERIRYETSNDTGLLEVFKSLGVVMAFFEILDLAVDVRKKQIRDANTFVGTYGQTQSTVHTTGTVLLGDQSWDAMSSRPIAPNSRVRVRRVILEVEEETA